MRLEDAWLLVSAQYRLAVWWPLAGYLIWWLLVRLCGVRSARTRFWSLLAVALLPPLVFVPPLLGFVGLHSPVEAQRAAARLATVPEGFQAPGAPGHPGSLWWPLVVWPFVAIPCGMLGAVLLGALEYLAAAVRLACWRKHRADGVFVLEGLGLGAFTFGLLRPRVYLTRAVWEGPHREAVLAHERAHARRRDPLLLFVARGIRRSTLYLPLGWRVYRDLHLEAEKACDEAGVAAVGRRRYAEALLDFAGARGPGLPAAPCFGEPWLVAVLLSLPALQLLATRLPGGWIVRRVEFLLAHSAHPERTLVFWFAFASAYLAILKLT